MKRIIEIIRRRNRARLERRRLFRESGQLPAGWFARFVYKLKARNHERVDRRRLHKHLLSSLAANDTAVLEALVFLLRTARQEQRARAESQEELAKRIASIEEKVDAGVRLVAAQLRVIEARLAALSMADETPERAGAGGNGRLRPPEQGAGGAQHATLRSEYGEEPMGRGSSGTAEPEGEVAVLATAPKRVL